MHPEIPAIVIVRVPAYSTPGSPRSACRCDKQLAAKKASGLKTERLALLAQREEVTLAAAELRSVRAISSAFHQRGDWRAPGQLRQRMQQLLPTVLRPKSAAR